MFIKGKEIIAFTVYDKEIQYFYIGDKLIWQAVRSCFGAGYWDNSKAWLNDEAYKN